MAGKTHSYPISLRWTGNTGQGTREYRGYERAHEYAIEGKPVILGSSDPAFRGDKTRHHPEELLVMALSSCHLLSYLHACATNKVVVVDYVDDAVGTMVESVEKGGQFSEVVLRPTVTIAADSDAALAESLHEQAHHHCFIANSVNFPVRCEPITKIQA